MSIPMKTIPGYYNERPGIQVGTKMEGEITLGKDGRYNFDEQGVRFIHGVEIYLTRQLSPQTRDNYHTILLAKNEEGVRELNALLQSRKEEQP